MVAVIADDAAAVERRVVALAPIPAAAPRPEVAGREARLDRGIRCVHAEVGQHPPRPRRFVGVQVFVAELEQPIAQRLGVLEDGDDVGGPDGSDEVLGVAGGAALVAAADVEHGARRGVARIADDDDESGLGVEPGEEGERLGVLGGFVGEEFDGGGVAGRFFDRPVHHRIAHVSGDLGELPIVDRAVRRLADGGLMLIEGGDGGLERGDEPPGEAALAGGEDVGVAVEEVLDPCGAGFGAAGDEGALWAHRIGGRGWGVRGRGCAHRGCRMGCRHGWTMRARAATFRRSASFGVVLRAPACARRARVRTF